MTCARKFVTQVCCSASDHYAAGHRFPTMKSAKQNRRSLVGTTAENQRANPTTLFGIGIGHSLLFHIAALLHGAFCLVLARLSACSTLILPAGIPAASRRDRPPSSGGVSRGNDKSDPRVLERRSATGPLEVEASHILIKTPKTISATRSDSAKCRFIGLFLRCSFRLAKSMLTAHGPCLGLFSGTRFPAAKAYRTYRAGRPRATT